MGFKSAKQRKFTVKDVIFPSYMYEDYVDYHNIYFPFEYLVTLIRNNRLDGKVISDSLDRFLNRVNSLKENVIVEGVDLEGDCLDKVFPAMAGLSYFKNNTPFISHCNNY